MYIYGDLSPFIFLLLQFVDYKNIRNVFICFCLTKPIEKKNEIFTTLFRNKLVAFGLVNRYIIFRSLSGSNCHNVRIVKRSCQAIISSSHGSMPRKCITVIKLLEFYKTYHMAFLPSVFSAYTVLIDCSISFKTSHLTSIIYWYCWLRKNSKGIVPGNKQLAKTSYLILGTNRIAVITPVAHRWKLAKTVVSIVILKWWNAKTSFLAPNT